MWQRFLNTDDIISLSEYNIFQNIFQYCKNSPNQYIDNNGHRYTPIGVGIQLDGTLGYGPLAAEGGIEVVLYWGTEEAIEKPVIAIYAYGGGSIGIDELGSDVKNVADMLLKSADSLRMDGSNALSALLSSMKVECSVSVSGFIVTGDETFTSAQSYTGPFDSVTGSAIFFKGSYAWSDNCRVYSVGWTPYGGSVGISYSRTYYKLLYSSVGNNFEE